MLTRTTAIFYQLKSLARLPVESRVVHGDLADTRWRIRRVLICRQPPF